MPLAAALLLVVMTPQDAPPAPKQRTAPAAEATADAPSALAAGQAAFRAELRQKLVGGDLESAVDEDSVEGRPLRVALGHRPGDADPALFHRVPGS